MRKLAVAAALLSSSCAQHTQNALVKTPPVPSVMDRQIINAIDAGDGDVEMRLLRDRVIALPESLDARLELAKAYAKRGFPELALDHYRFAAERSPESAEAHLALAKALDQSGRTRDGIAILSAFLAAHPQSGPDLYTWLGNMRDDAGDYKSSELAYRDALSKSPEDRDYLHNNLGFSLLKQGDAEKAAAEFRAALALNPRSEIARDNLADALSTSNSPEAVVNLQSLNEPAIAHSNLAAVLIERGNYPEARKELDLALRYNRANPAALANLELLSNLDGKPASIPAPPAAPPNHWARMKTFWHRWVLGDGPASNQQVQVTAKSESKSETKP